MNEKQYGTAVLLAATILASAPEAQSATIEQRVARLEEQVDALGSAQADNRPFHGVQIGGYGEMHYNNLSGHEGAGDKEEIDFHRFVIHFGYGFSDRIRFGSEVELEHSLSGDDAPGEVELEQAYIDFDLTETHTARGGLFLLPVGWLNSTHEPATFYGVERNPIENKIIPTTWWEAGAGVHGAFGEGWNYAAYVHSGLNTSSNDGYTVRSGRQKAAKAQASDLAGTVALDWAVPGFTAGGAVVYQTDMTQGNDPMAGEGVLGEIHAEIRQGPFALRALYAEWKLDGNGPEAMGADRQYGWFVEPSFRPIPEVGVFVRCSKWDNQAGDAAERTANMQFDAGVNWWPHEQIVIKADYQWQDNENGKEQNGFNLGIGYDF